MANNGWTARVELICPYCHIVYELELSEIGSEDALCIYCGSPLIWHEGLNWR